MFQARRADVRLFLFGRCSGPAHAPVIATLRPGVLDVTSSAGKKRLFVKAGFAGVDPTRLTVLAQKAYDVADLQIAFNAGGLRLP